MRVANLEFAPRGPRAMLRSQHPRDCSICREDNLPFILCTRHRNMELF